jgi:hypothetical protein
MTILAGNAAIDWETRYRSSVAKQPNPLVGDSSHCLPHYSPHYLPHYSPLYDHDSTIHYRPVSTQVTASAAEPDLTNPHRAQSFA